MKVLRGALSFPPVLYLVSHEDAIFQLVNESSGPLKCFRNALRFLNGQPVWRCFEKGKEACLYSTADGFWCLSPKARRDSRLVFSMEVALLKASAQA